MRFQATVQEALLAVLLFDSKHAPIVAGLVEAKHYGAFHRELAERAIEYVDSFGCAPGEHAYDIYQEAIFSRPDAEEALEAVFKSVEEAREGLNPQYVIDRARKFVRAQVLTGAIQRAVDALQLGTEDGVDAAEDEVRTALEERDVSQDPGIFIDDFEQSLQFARPDRPERWPIGIRELDERRCNLAPGELFTFMGLSGHGKSWFLTHVAKTCLIMGRRILYITLEISAQDVLERAFRSLFAVALDEQSRDAPYWVPDVSVEGTLMGYKLERAEKTPTFETPYLRGWLRHNYRKSRLGKLLVKNYPADTLSIRGLEAYLDTLERVHNYVPEVVLIDYPDLMLMEGKQDLRIETGRIYKGLVRIGQERHMSMVAVTQANRDGRSAKLLTSQHTAEDITKHNCSDVYVTMSSTMAEKRYGYCRLFVEKCRRGESTYQVAVFQNYNIGAFCVDSIMYEENSFEGATGRSETPVESMAL